VLDPNSDYVRLSEVRDESGSPESTAYAAAAADVAVWQNDPEALSAAYALGSAAGAAPTERQSA